MEFGQVRVVIGPGGEPWFVAADVVQALGYRNAPDMTRNLDSEDISTHILRRNQRGNPNVTIISESGLYTTIIHSRRPEAKKFKRYATSEVLPTIRKNGIYVTDEMLKNVMSDPSRRGVLPGKGSIHK